MLSGIIFPTRSSFFTNLGRSLKLLLDQPFCAFKLYNSTVDDNFVSSLRQKVYKDCLASSNKDLNFLVSGSSCALNSGESSWKSSFLTRSSMRESTCSPILPNASFTCSSILGYTSSSWSTSFDTDGFSSVVARLYPWKNQCVYDLSIPLMSKCSWINSRAIIPCPFRHLAHGQGKCLNPPPFFYVNSMKCTSPSKYSGLNLRLVIHSLFSGDDILQLMM